MDPPDGSQEKLRSWEKRACFCLAMKARYAQDPFSDEKYSADPVRHRPRLGALGL